MTAPVPWSLAWRDDGELAPQDHFDLLQSLVTSETETAQHGLVVAMERLSLEQVCLLSSGEVTELCA
jgi:hypothetical protein